MVEQHRATATEDTDMQATTPTYVLCADTWTTTGDHTPHVLGAFAFLGDLSDAAAAAACAGMENDTEACAEIHGTFETTIDGLCTGLGVGESVSFEADTPGNSWTYVVARVA